MMFSFHRFRALAARWLTRVSCDEKGVAALEFAIMMPLLLLVYAGAVDVTRGVIASRKLNQLSRTVSDLVSQQPSSTALTPATISSIFAASSAIMNQYGTSSLTLTVSAVDIQYNTTTKSCCNALVRWSYTQNGTLRACSTSGLTQVANGVTATSTNIPSALVTANVNAGYGYSATNSSYLIVTDASFTYTPIFQQATSWFASAISKTTWMVPRATSGPIKLSSSATAPSSSNSYTGGATCFN